jgi:hypothetical protein
LICPEDPIMPSSLHEAFVTLFNAHIALGLRLAAQVGVELQSPLALWKVVGGEFSDPSGQGRRYATDLVLTACSPESESVTREALIFEPQLSFEAQKAVSWLVYRGGVAARYGHCGQWLLTISPTPGVLSRYREEVYDRNRELEPIFVGPGSVTPVLDLAEAKKDPIWAAFCAAMHCRGPLGIAAAAVAIEAGASLPADARRCTLQLIIAGMKKNQMQDIHKQMPEPIKHELSEYEREGAWYVHGVEVGLQRALLATLAVRGLDPDDEQRARIDASEDTEQLQRWIERAALATSLAEVFVVDA